MIKIKQPEECCGCGACVQRCPQQCIVMHVDAEGFLYPEVDTTRCIECGLCEKICPVLHPNCRPELSSMKVYACMNKDETTRMASSSGGVFSLLADRTLAQGGVVFGARFDETFAVRHDFVEDAGELNRLRGSKYSQSVMGMAFLHAEEFLKAGREVLFTGTSCQIAGLKRYLGRPFTNLLAVDVLCHGVPSPKVFARYLAQQACRVDQDHTGTYQLDQLEFRNKKEKGWGRYCIVSHYVPVTMNGGESVRLSEPFTHEMYMRGFLHNLYLRPACHACPVRGLSAGSDLTIADYWGIGKRHPEMDDNKGTSLVIAQTERGRAAFATLSESLETIETPFKEALPGNPCLLHSVRPHRNRRNFFSVFENSDNLPELILRLTRKTLYERLLRKIRGVMHRIALMR